MHDEVKARTLFATHYHELTRLAGRLTACRCTMSGRVNGRATWSCCTRSPMAPPTAATALRSPGLPECRRWSSPAPRKCWIALEEGREATGGIAAGLDDLPLFAAAVPTELPEDPLDRSDRGARPRPVDPARGARRALRTQATGGGAAANEPTLRPGQRPARDYRSPRACRTDCSARPATNAVPSLPTRSTLAGRRLPAA